MKVIFSLPCNFGDWGMGITGYYIAKSFYDHGILDYILAPSFVKREIPVNYVKTTYSKIAPMIYRLPNLRIGLQTFIRGFLHDVLSKKKLRKADIFYTFAGGSYLSMIRAKELNTKIVILENPTSHIINRLRRINEENKKLDFAPIWLPYLKYFLMEYELADYIRVPSEYAYKSFIELGVPEKKLILIPYGVDIDKFHPPKNKNRNINKLQLLYVGGITPHKGIRYLLEAVEIVNRKAKRVELTLVGHMFKSGLRLLSSYSKLINFKYISFTRNVLDFYHKADVFVYPSLEEGSALVTYEAMACGLPVITTFESGSVVRDGIDGFIVPAGDVKTLAEKILFFYENPQRIKMMGETAYQHVQKYSWKMMGEKIIKFIYQILTT